MSNRDTGRITYTYSWLSLSRFLKSMGTTQLGLTIKGSRLNAANYGTLSLNNAKIDLVFAANVISMNGLNEQIR